VTDGKPNKCRTPNFNCVGPTPILERGKNLEKNCNILKGYKIRLNLLILLFTNDYKVRSLQQFIGNIAKAKRKLPSPHPSSLK